ncbi:MAG: hypothetical protein ABI181_02965 [Mycobacteriaceae bacterium]
MTIRGGAVHRIETASTPGAGPPAATGQLPVDVPAAERLRRLRADLLGGYGKGATRQQFLSVTRERPLAVATPSAFVRAREPGWPMPEALVNPPTTTPSPSEEEPVARVLTGVAVGAIVTRLAASAVHTLRRSPNDEN